MARGSDRLEALLIVLAAVVLAVPAPIAALSAGRSVHAQRVATMEQERAAVRQVQAIADADSASAATRVGPARTVEARWMEAFTQRQATVRVDHDVAAGERFAIWLDRNGRVVAAPLTASAARLDAIVVTVGTWLGIAVACMVATGIARFVLDRRRLRSWAREWALFMNNDDGWANRGRFR